MALTDEFKEEFDELYDEYPHEKTAREWIKGKRHITDKHRNVMSLVNPQKGDTFIECGPSSGKLAVDLAIQGANVHGYDLDKNAIEVSNALKRLCKDRITGELTFTEADLTTATYPETVNKVLVIDFTEHVEDEIMIPILENIKSQVGKDFTLYCYTPNRTHLFEHMQAREFLLPKNPTHIALRTMEENCDLLERAGFTIEKKYHRPSHVPVYRQLERVLALLPGKLGQLFKRRVCIVAKPNSTSTSS